MGAEEAERPEAVASMTAKALRLIPILGWVYLVVGWCRRDAPVAQRYPLLRAVWWIDLALSVGAHGLQVPAAVRKVEPGGDRLRAGVRTMVFGMTWSEEPKR